MYAYEFSDFSKEENVLVNFNEKFVKVQSFLNLKNRVVLANKNQNLILMFTRNHSRLPLTNVSLDISTNLFNLVTTIAVEPFYYSYEPNIIDSFPLNEIQDVSTVSLIS